MCQPYIRNIIQQMQQSAQRGQKQHWSAPFFIFYCIQCGEEAFPISLEVMVSNTSLSARSSPGKYNYMT